ADSTANLHVAAAGSKHYSEWLISHLRRCSQHYAIRIHLEELMPLQEGPRPLAWGTAKIFSVLPRRNNSVQQLLFFHLLVLQDLESRLPLRDHHEITPENFERISALENHNEALVDRMETIEDHLLERSRALSQCRYSYFLEITHLRNQVYLQGLNPDEFDPHECYFFDPLDSLEEELREMLNQKIKDSVRVYYGKWRKAEDKLQRLQDQLDALRANIDPAFANQRAVKPLAEELAFLASHYTAAGVVKGCAEEFP
ncbi:unnamed protein product, partial [Amoebophrya sp. A25]